MRLGMRAATFDVRGVSREDVVSAITGAEFGVGASLEKSTREQGKAQKSHEETQ